MLNISKFTGRARISSSGTLSPPPYGDPWFSGDLSGVAWCRKSVLAWTCHWPGNTNDHGRQSIDNAVAVCHCIFNSLIDSSFRNHQTDKKAQEWSDQCTSRHFPNNKEAQWQTEREADWTQRVNRVDIIKWTFAQETWIKTDWMCVFFNNSAKLFFFSQINTRMKEWCTFKETTGSEWCTHKQVTISGDLTNWHGKADVRELRSYLTDHTRSPNTVWRAPVTAIRVRLRKTRSVLHSMHFVCGARPRHEFVRLSCPLLFCFPFTTLPSLAKSKVPPGWWNAPRPWSANPLTKLVSPQKQQTSALVGISTHTHSRRTVLLYVEGLRMFCR